MHARILNIVILFLVTLASVSLVEGGYWILERVLFSTAGQKAPAVKTSVGKKRAAKTLVAKKHTYEIILKRNLFGDLGEKDFGEAYTDLDDHDELKPTELDLVLMGTISGEEEVNRAFILDKKNNKQSLYEVGDALKGAFVKKIMRGKVILTHNGQDEMLDMSEAASIRKEYLNKKPVQPKKINMKKRIPSDPVAVAPGPPRAISRQVDGRVRSQRIIRYRKDQPNQAGSPEEMQ